MAARNAGRAILPVLTDESTSTDVLYDRVGYAALLRAGIVPYRAFRDALAELEASGEAVSEEGRDGATLWRLRRPDDPPLRPADGE